MLAACPTLSNYYLLDDTNQTVKMAYNMYGEKYAAHPYLSIRFDVTKDEQMEFTSLSSRILRGENCGIA